jgi:hypothetical protein
MLKMFKQLISIIFSGFLMSSLARADSGFNIDPLFNDMAMEAKEAIQKHDNEYFLRYVAAEGIVLDGRVYSKEQISVLLNNKHNTFNKYLYSGKTSIKHFFDTIHNPEVKITKRGGNSILIIYASKELTETRSVKNCYIKISNHWYLDGIFSCE